MSDSSRRTFLSSGVALALSSALLGCRSPSRPAVPPIDPTPPFDLEPLAHLVAAAGLRWLITVEPKTILSSPELTLAVGQFLTNARLDALAKRNYVDVRSFDEIAFASFNDTELVMGRGFFDPAKFEAAMAAHNTVDSRRAQGSLVDIDTHFGTLAERFTLFSSRGVARERGKAGPLRAARLFAEGKLKRARPALDVEPLNSAAVALGAPWPARIFYPGPFTDDWERAAGGLFRTATALAGGARPARTEATSGGRAESNLELVAVVMGRWDDVDGAKARLGAAIDRLLGSDLGRLMGTDKPVEPLHVEAVNDSQGLRARVVVRATPLFAGLHAALDATAEEIFR